MGAKIVVKISSDQHKRLNGRDVLISQPGYAQGYPPGMGMISQQ
jgi:hypothetical protein